MSTPIPKGLRAAVLVLLPCLTTSCFTMGLWGFDLETEADPRTHAEETTFVYDEATQWSVELVLLRLLLTPVTVGLDCLTAPVQAVLLGDDEAPAACGR